ncbi:hypothetical protein D3797_008035 [Bacillus subtilis]|nr:hypothetical protein D3797_008035 [Bacillus subtilis]
MLNDPETFLAAKDGEVTDEILQAALEIITEQLKERRKQINKRRLFIIYFCLLCLILFTNKI